MHKHIAVTRVRGYVHRAFGSERRAALQNANSCYPCKVLKGWCKVEHQKVVDESSSIILVEQALLGTFQGVTDQLVPVQILSASPSVPPAVPWPHTGIGHPL